MWPSELILNHHGLGEPCRGAEPADCAYWLPVETFRETLDIVSGRKAPGISISITFDDGNVSDFEEAMPALLDRGLTASFFVLAGRIDRPGSLSASQIREMSQAGMTIGSHGWDHIDWRSATKDALRKELYDARSRLQDVLGLAVDSIAVPFGLIGRRVVAEARSAGYRRIYTSSGGLTGWQEGLIARNCLTSDFSPRRDLPRLLSWQTRLRSAVRDPLRRIKYASW